MTTAIIDYGMGNLRSVSNAVAALGGRAAVARAPAELRGAERIILPGVGAFFDGMENLKRLGWIDALEEEVRLKGKPFLGLCLGMQLLATTGTEHGAHAGLGWIPGTVQRMAGGPSVRVPHIGWNDVRVVKRDGLYRGVEESPSFYFVHSYVMRPEDGSVVSGFSSHGGEFAASIEAGNLWATQFHPEKSQKAGLAALKNFLERTC